MIEIPADEDKVTFASDFLFERTGNIRENINELSREELMDLNKLLYKRLENVQGITEKLNDFLERVLGYREPL